MGRLRWQVSSVKEHASLQLRDSGIPSLSEFECALIVRINEVCFFWRVFAWGRSCAAKFCVEVRSLTAKCCWSRGVGPNVWEVTTYMSPLVVSERRPHWDLSIRPFWVVPVFFCEISALLSLFEIRCILSGSQVKENKTDRPSREASSSILRSA